MIEKGLSATSSVVVAKENTAIFLGSGGLEVFATPAMIALMESAAAKAIAPFLGEGESSVGTEVNITHIKASAVGAEIVASAVVTEVNGREITFNVGARDGESLIGEGVHKRFVINSERFMAKLK